MSEITLDTAELRALLLRLEHAEARNQELLESNNRTVDMMRAKLGVNELCRRAHSDAKDKGWYDPPPSTIERLCLIHSEVSEALECVRNGEMKTEIQEDEKPTGFATELSDVVIRVADLCGYLGIDLEAEIRRKMAFNKTREHRHGGKAA